MSGFIKRYFKELLLLIYIALAYEIYFARLADLGLSITAIVYVILFGILLLTLMFAANISNALIRLTYGLVFYISSVFFDVYEKITSDFLSYNAFISLFNSQEFIADTLFQYFVPIALAMLAGLLLLIGIVMRPLRSSRLPQKVLVVFPLVITLMFSVMLYVRGGDGARALPSHLTLINYASLAIYEASNEVVGIRQQVMLEREDKNIPFDIVYVIDESISANYLDINTQYGIVTNLNKKHDGFTIFNYGYAAAISNCSYDVNSTLRYGGTRENYLKINSTMPSMWAYAKKAGLRTVYIDTQRDGGKFQNGMDNAELAFIDEFIQFDGMPIIDRDIAAAKKLAEQLNNDSSDFIFINKTGAHFPVHDKYPDEFMIYKPALKRGQFLNISYTGSREGFDGGDDEWLQYRNSYKNTLSWNVGEFFATLFNAASLDKTVLIYTSDHGQDLHERGNPGQNTHCGSNPNIEEGLVPLVVIEGDSVKGLDWKKYFDDNANASSHYNIFPTLLSLMLYDPQQIKSVYGNSLHTKTNDPFTFNIYFNARLGKKPIWKKINLDDIVVPGASD